MSEGIEIYNGAPFKVLNGNEIWATQKDMATAFDVNIPAISKHVNNILESGELQRVEVVSKMEITATDGKTYLTDHYNLDMVIAVGFRVKSAVGTAFRRWANGVIKKYATEGVVINPYAGMSQVELLRKYADEIEAKERLLVENNRLTEKTTELRGIIKRQDAEIKAFMPYAAIPKPCPEGYHQEQVRAYVRNVKDKTKGKKTLAELIAEDKANGQITLF